MVCGASRGERGQALLYRSKVKKAADYVSKCIRYCEENEVPSYWGLCFEMFMKDLTEEA